MHLTKKREDGLGWLHGRGCLGPQEVYKRTENKNNVAKTIYSKPFKSLGPCS